METLDYPAIEKTVGAVGQSLARGARAIKGVTFIDSDNVARAFCGRRCCYNRRENFVGYEYE
ncbi:MAG: hypothetical protein HN366_25665 [Deltaproteobacteria bacterium]|jgi:hypothetical protein|nr:hypothetical protein [Deltaproteobacteria bacterium]